MKRRAIFNTHRTPGRVMAGNTSPADTRTAGNKFGAKKAACFQQHEHASRAEARRCNQLYLMQRGHAIRDLEQQPQFWFVINGEQVRHEGGRRVGYRADFAYFENDRHIVEDVKGAYRDDAWTLRKAIFRALFPDIIFREVS